ncbi:MFS family permease [Bradyrhizobium sp. USDA 4501]
MSAAVSPNYTTLLLSRIVMAVAHGVFFGVGAACASSLVLKARAGSAIAVMMGGLTVAMVVGVPLGSWIGQLFNWRTPFLIVTGMGTIAVLGLTWLLPREISHQQPASFATQLSLLGNRRLATMYLLTVVGFGGTFVVFTFLSPLLTDVTGVPEEAVNIALLLFGATTVGGNLAGGTLSDVVGTRNAMMILLSGLIVSFVSLRLAIHNEAATFVVIAVLGGVCFRHSARYAGRRCCHGEAGGSRCAWNGVRLQYSRLQSRNLERVFHRWPALERARAAGDPLRVNRDGERCLAVRDGCTPSPLCDRQCECCVTVGAVCRTSVLQRGQLARDSESAAQFSGQLSRNVRTISRSWFLVAPPFASTAIP